MKNYAWYIASLVLMMIVLSSAGEETKSVDRLTEDELLTQLKKADNLTKLETKAVISELGRRKVKKAIDPLFEVLTFSAETELEKWTTGGSKKTYEDRYPALAALSEIPGVSVSNCVDRLSKVQAKSTEESLLVRLGILIDREAFMRAIRDRRDAGGKKQKRWVRISEAYSSKDESE